MPAMRRDSSLARRVVFSLLGKPANFRHRTERQKRIDRTIFYQSLSRVK